MTPGADDNQAIYDADLAAVDLIDALLRSRIEGGPAAFEAYLMQRLEPLPPLAIVATLVTTGATLVSLVADLRGVSESEVIAQLREVSTLASTEMDLDSMDEDDER